MQLLPLATKFIFSKDSSLLDIKFDSIIKFAFFSRTILDPELTSKVYSFGKIKFLSIFKKLFF